MPDNSRKTTALGLAIASSLLLLPTALWSASGITVGQLSVDTIWGFLPLALILIVVGGAWAAQTSPQLRLWGILILGSCFLQFFVSLPLGLMAAWATATQIPAPIMVIVVLAGIIVGMMSGILLIAEQSRAKV